MTRINTNVSSLIAQNTLGRSNVSLNQALTRLSTGLRINTGKDDPAGLIASENLRSDITSIRRAISNTDRANQVIATADSALGQVSSLLNDIRGLVTESANSGALSSDQIAANQLQLDSSLEALNRIAQTTTFQGRRLLDGSLDFLTTLGTNSTNISTLKIDQANLGTSGTVSVDINVSTAATQALVSVASIPTGIAPVTGSDGTIDFQTTAVPVATQATGTHTFGTTTTVGFNVTAVVGQAAEGATGALNGGVDLIFTDNDDDSGTVNTVTYDNVANTLTIDADFDGSAGGNPGVIGSHLAAAIDADGTFVTSAPSAGIGNALVVADAITYSDVTTGGSDAVAPVDAAITISPAFAGDFNRTITFISTADLGAGVATATDNGTTLAISVDDDTDVDLSAIVTAIQGAIGTTNFTTTLVSTTGDSQFNTTVDTDPTLTNVGATTPGVSAADGLTDAVVLELSGSDGSEVLSFGVGTTIAQLVAGINLVSDATGVLAAANGTTATTLDLSSAAYGLDAFVDLKVISEGTGTPTFTNAVGQGQRATGADIIASINGVTATGSGNDLSINTATLDLSATFTANFIGTASFTITGGGALFQLGPDVVSNQQARLGVGSVNTARLGGTSGKLFQLGTGGSTELTSTSLDIAAKIVEEAIDQVTSLRGRLGAFQRTTLETNKQALKDTLVNLTDAESSIRDADFAAEAAALTRAQILVQSGTTVLQIANQNPQNVLALLR